MNYRQWKKNYKKRHGHNPPLEADKRQRAKAMRNTITANDIVTTIQNMADAVQRALTERIIAELYRALSNGFRAAADAAQSIAEQMEGATNDSNRDI